jgi:PKD repeat protein
MKTISTLRKKLSIILFSAVLLLLNTNAKAQCTANFTFTVNTANNGAVAFISTSTGSMPLNVFWLFGDGDYSPMNCPTHIYNSTGTYTVCLIVIDSTSSCSDSTCQTISVINNSPIGGCNASFISYDSLGYTYFFNSSMGIGLTSLWNFGDGTTGTSVGNTTHFYNFPGTYNVCLTISNFLGTCIDTFCSSITVNTGFSGACQGVVNPTFTYSESSGNITFYNTPSGSTPVYHWDFGDGNTSTDIGNTSHTYASNGTYLTCLTVYETSGGTDSCQYCNNVIVSGAPYCNASFFIVQDSMNLFNYNIYNTSSSSGVMSYYWDFGDGTSSTLQYPSHAYSSSSPVQICLTISSGMLCTATYCDSINPGHSPSSGFTINVLPLGISEQHNNISSFENYPNPFSDNTTITYTLSKQENIELCVFDLLGNKVSSIESGNKNAGTHTVIWNAENLNQGMYLLQLKAGGNNSTKKIIINK